MFEKSMSPDEELVTLEAMADIALVMLHWLEGNLESDKACGLMVKVLRTSADKMQEVRRSN